MIEQSPDEGMVSAIGVVHRHHPHPVIDQWINEINSGQAKQVCSLYSSDAILLPTLSPDILCTPQEILDYFEFFLDRESLSVTLVDCYVQQYSEVKIDSGVYQFTWIEGGHSVATRARFTFVIRNGAIVEHHSSLSPSF